MFVIKGALRHSPCDCIDHLMNLSSRRHLLRKGAVVCLGTVAATGVAMGRNPAETELRRNDPELARILSSYGRTDALKPAGFRTMKVGGRKVRLPVSRIGMRVGNQASFRQSFAKLAELSERVHVAGNTVCLARGGTCYVIENRVA